MKDGPEFERWGYGDEPTTQDERGRRGGGVGADGAGRELRAGGLPTRQVKLDNFCTLEVRILQEGGSSYVAARKFGIDWVDASITGGQSEGCRTRRSDRISATTDQGTKGCTFWVPDGMFNTPGPGCTGFAPDWYQAAQPGELSRRRCTRARPPCRLMATTATPSPAASRSTHSSTPTR